MALYSETDLIKPFSTLLGSIVARVALSCFFSSFLAFTAGHIKIPELR